MRDYWSEGYQAAMNGATYADNPYQGQHGATAWVFGCGEGMKERNRKSFQDIINVIRGN